MPYELDWHSNGSHWTFRGHVPFAEIFEANKEFYDDPRSDRVRYQLIDCSGVDTVDWPADEIRKIAAIDVGGSYSIEKLRIAFVSTKADITGKLETYQDVLRITNSSWQVRIFSCCEEAFRWCRA